VTKPAIVNEDLVLHVITGLNDGGAEAALFRLCTHDKKLRHHVVSLMGAGKYGPLLQQAGIDVSCLNMPRGRVSFAGLQQLWRLVQTTRPAVVQTWMYHGDLVGGIAARLAGVSNVSWGIHNTVLVRGESTATTIMVAKLCAMLSRLVPRRIVCCAERARAVHVDLGYDRGRMRVIPNGYDLSVFQPDQRAGAKLRTDLGLRPDGPLVGFVARYDSQKDHATLFRSLALLKARDQQPTCLLVGAGMTPDNQALTSMLDAHGLTDRVHLLGRRDDIPAVMSALDLHIMSSSAEAFPNVLAEAMACGTPCVSTDVGDAATIVGDTGWIVPIRQPEALASAILEALALRHTEQWQDRRLAARARIIDNFAIARMVGRYHEAWRS
jgi:glycosyltransferase involved in cell wall biosynthesis